MYIVYHVGMHLLTIQRTLVLLGFFRLSLFVRLTSVLIVLLFKECLHTVDVHRFLHGIDLVGFVSPRYVHPPASVFGDFVLPLITAFVVFIPVLFELLGPCGAIGC